EPGTWEPPNRGIRTEELGTIEPPEPWNHWNPGTVPMRLLIAVLLTLTAAVSAQVRYTAATDLVVLNVHVTDDSGAPVAGLKADNFQVYEDGQLQSIAAFADADAPVT